jgi:2-methylisocitrate lyase-like PEP mutase family enzyme
MTVMPMSDRVATYRHLHESGCFVLPNPFDVGSARLLASLGYKALASTSAGFAWTMGRSDYGLKLDELLEHLTELSAATDLPVNADFESGFADEPAGVAENVRKAAATGVAGLSVENRTTDPKNPLYDFELSVERIRAARAALDDDESGVLLVARCEGFLTGEANLDMTIKRLVAFAEAGADCLYAPGIRTREQISAVVKAVAPKPVNVLVMSPDFKVAELAELGVRRVSLGGQLAAAAWGGFMRAAKEIAEQGTFSELKNSYSGRDITKVFAQYITK